jgi:hypothetical protein
MKDWFTSGCRELYRTTALFSFGVPAWRLLDDEVLAWTEEEGPQTSWPCLAVHSRGFATGTAVAPVWSGIAL